jgi:hypothetical protein
MLMVVEVEVAPRRVNAVVVVVVVVGGTRIARAFLTSSLVDEDVRAFR